MQRIILQKSIFKNTYENIECSDTPIWILERFFNDLSLIHIPFYIKWSLDIKPSRFEGNDTVLKKENHMIYIGSLFSDQLDEGPFFIISADQFAKLLNEWEKLAKAKVPKINITLSDDGIINVEGE